MENEKRLKAHHLRTLKFAKRSKSRIDHWLHDQVLPGPFNDRSTSTMSGANAPKLKDPIVESMLAGVYKSSNVNLHDFRLPIGKIVDLNMP